MVTQQLNNSYYLGFTRMRTVQVYNTSTVPALRTGIIHNDK